MHIRHGFEKITRTLVVPVLVILLLFSIQSMPIEGADGDSAPLTAEGLPTAGDVVLYRENGYETYSAAHLDAPRPDSPIMIDATTYSSTRDMTVEILDDYAGMPGSSLLTGEEGSVEWTVDVGIAGVYNIEVDYYPIEGKSASIERSLYLDGTVPFLEANNILFTRIWGNKNAVVIQDQRGNDLRAQQIEKPEWQKTAISDAQGYFELPFGFYFTQGTHTITLESLREPMVIRQIRLCQQTQPLTYAAVLAQYESSGLKPVKEALVVVQGEDAVRKSDPTLYPVNDRTSPATEPYHVSKIRMNMIGGYNWRMPGQWIEWEIEAPEDGLYQLAFKSRQNELRGIYSTRKLTIDGTVPFKEVEKIRFIYDRNWNMHLLGDDAQPYLFHLTKGVHKIRLEVSLGDIAPLIRQVENSVLELNRIYRQVIKLTGTEPDLNRDYGLDKQIPDLVKRLHEQSKILYQVGAVLEGLTGEKSESVAPLYRSAYQLEDLANRPETIQNRITEYRDNTGALGTWILSVREQPLDIDYLVLAGSETKLPKADATFFEKVGHEFLAFFYSFFEDYSTIGDTVAGDKRVTVWIGTGRDQAQILKSLINDSFTPDQGISVDLKLTDMSVLLTATLAGQGPDVAMQVGNSTPVNFAMRNAAQDLTVFAGFDEVAKRFYDSALVPYKYLSSVYALPETQTFSMFFYRKDIFEELGLSVPQTWDELYDLIPELQKNNLQLALPLEQNFTRSPAMQPNATFLSFLYQIDGSLYVEDGKKTDLESEAAMNSFRKWTELYTNYRLPLTFDFANRFRTGEMPAGIADYSMYNLLSVSAPELRGLWAFVPIPGTLTAKGEIRRDEPSGGIAVMMLDTAKNKENAWEYMKWWTSTDTQVRFGREMEGLMGAAARYPTANIEALEQLPWPVKDKTNLQDQWKWVQGIPEIPGGYFTGRQLDNAFRKVVNENINARETLFEYSELINNEIALKRQEFGLSN